MKKLERSRADRVLGGVCGGVARHLGVDADVVRLIWLVSVVLAGMGILPYLAGLYLLPEADEPRSGPAPAEKLVGFGLLFLGVLFFFRTFDARVLDPTVLAFWKIQALGPLVLLACGTFLVWPRIRGFLGTRGRRPTRSLTDRVLSGVAGGIAREWGTDPNVVRLAFVATASLTFGLAVLVYLLLVLVLPEDPVGAPGVPPPPPGDAGGGDQAVSGGGR